jgi:hypothetical protein
MDEPATRSWSDRLTPLAFVVLVLDLITFAFTVSGRNGEPVFSVISASLIVAGVIICRRLRRDARLAIAPQGLTLFAFDVGDESGLEERRCVLSFKHSDDPDGFFNVHFDGWAVDAVVRND